ncbi:cytochrome c peroxidase [Labrenzia sp. 011]|uniref:cytochrome-c peroxidase n=1 Tax=Labrenzia sp. 011 TaxID=2171494 RepID=UPI000D520314|nr:cytochrome c peroxidase [Labrenzia sp. 011]PVB62382.1 hypothetical protein DCO57_06380 [Labrenzia sp. 011]
MIRFRRLLAGLLLFLGAGAAGAQGVLLDQGEIDAALLHGPWPPPRTGDPSNRVSGIPEAIELGRILFSSPALSSGGRLSCASCHDPDNGFTDGLETARSHVGRLDRNTQGLFNLAGMRWFGWDGRSDSLWAQSLLPIIRSDEMALDVGQIADALQDGPLRERYEGLFGPADSQAPDRNLANVGKALAAYIETITTGKTPFDRFRDALEAGDLEAAAAYPEDAQRGFRIFAGKGKCTFCHVGPLFSNSEFHDAGVPYFVEPTRVDTGRHGGIEALLGSRFTLRGAFSDDPAKTGAWKVERLVRSHDDFGTFRTPSLRELTRTAPYMHNGSLATLRDVVNHYSTIDLERMHTDGEAILEPLDLSERETADLVAFLESLSTR